MNGLTLKDKEYVLIYDLLNMLVKLRAGVVPHLASALWNYIDTLNKGENNE